MIERLDKSAEWTYYARREELVQVARQFVFIMAGIGVHDARSRCQRRSESAFTFVSNAIMIGRNAHAKQSWVCPAIIQEASRRARREGSHSIGYFLGLMKASRLSGPAPK